jgi:hypothetical protein
MYYSFANPWAPVQPVVCTQQPQPNGHDSRYGDLLRLHIGGQTPDTLLNVLALNGDHLSEQRFGAFWCAPAQVAFAAFGTHYYPGPAQAETLRGGFMGLEFDFAGF